MEIPAIYQTTIGVIAGTLTAVSMLPQLIKLIKEKEVRRIETILSADDMQGRRTFTPGIEKAAAFIADEFKATGLQTLNNSGSYLQSFAMVRTKFLGASGTFDGAALDKKDIVVITDAFGLDKKQLKNIDKNNIPYFIIPKAEQKNNVAVLGFFKKSCLSFVCHSNRK